ncbi:hypothetical protein DCAR_0416389 [Daucus carota subsp. sativus]|nr:PREDICTED: RNA polymerase sigma factor sigE, chloroplastic/mitochondrial [Daucus carota subsp. sativus]XP_017246840.1 PREDICTED: RNA polymerase sigma factor sigE, chloroplastic/mitochondrial [Daucus carota subsp. sativus]WOG97050.1 hypothetical protein DCAR_0416389 [Daucus carota subsp. sativus]
MGVVTVSSSAARTPLGSSTRLSKYSFPTKRTSISMFKTDKTKNKALVAPKDAVSSAIEKSKGKRKILRQSKKPLERVQAFSVAEAPSCPLDLDYYEAAAKLENIYKLSPAPEVYDGQDEDHGAKTIRKRRKKKIEENEKKEDKRINNVVRSQKTGLRRMSLEKRIELKINKEAEVQSAMRRRKLTGENESEKINRLVREYSVSTDLVSLDWKKMKIPPVLSSSEHTWLFKLMQPMKAILLVKDNLQNDLGREPTDGELAKATGMNVVQLRKQIAIGKAARSKLIKHNLRLILFVMNKYFQEFTNGPKFQDLCQAGVKGLITAIDRFEPKRRLRLSTYSLFWIRHTIIRSMTLASFTKVSFGLESVRAEIQKVKLQLMFELHREPTEEEIIEKVGISRERYNEVMRASKPVFSLHARHSVTQEEFISGITDFEGAGGDKRRQPALLRLALDDVLDSLKPKESLVIRQRYGLDGKGDRTLGEIGGNLNISREMVRKHEVKAFMKLKHPTRVDYLRRYIL